MFFVLLSAPAAEAPTSQPQPVFHSSLQAASEAATADESLVLLDFSAEWCGPCKLLKSKTFAAPEFLQQAGALHIAEVDIDANKKMAGNFGIEAVPTLILMTADGKILLRQTGYVEVPELLAWIKSGRVRAAGGQWEGIAPGAQFGDLIQKAAADNIGTNDLQKLIELLGDPDPANRDQAGKILLGLRESAMPSLIQAAGDPYLGVRVSATELLRQLAPVAPAIDPWQSPPEITNAVAGLRKWWAAAGKLPPAAAAATNALPANIVKEALDQLRGDDPVRRTAAMTLLVRLGSEVLPAVRDAIKRAEKNGDQRTLGLLEDVRWTILVSDAVELQSGGLRAVLARGKSSERQAATEKLGHIGRDALGVLIELAGDPDPLVVESSIRALSGINGGDTVSALALLLKSGDSNLRMTAAQALGRTKNPAAVKPLLDATTDTDEVVVCTAISALEETQSSDSYRSRPVELSSDFTAALRRCLADPRWRVRAAAAEAAGKLSSAKLTGDLKKLLDDPDGFVVKSALTALSELNALPVAPKLVELGKRLPSLQGDMVQFILRTESDETAATITDMFKNGNADTRVAILNALARRDSSDSTGSVERWKPLLSQAITSPDAKLRRGAAEVLAGQPPKLAAQLVQPLLADEDAGTRRAAVGVVLGILDRDSGGTLSRRSSYYSSRPKTTQPSATAARLAEWHAALLKHAGPAPELDVVAAIFLTGDGKSDLPRLLAALGATNGAAVKSRSQQVTDKTAIGLLATKLSLSEGQPLLDKLVSSPDWFALAASQSLYCQPAVRDYLLEPVRFRLRLEPASGPVLEECLELLAGYDYNSEDQRKWDLWTESDRTKAIALALVNCTNAAWRAAAVFSLGLRADGKDHLPVFEKALADPSPWVRGSGIRALARNVKDRALLEQRAGPLVADTNLSVATAAAAVLLEPEILDAAGMEFEVSYFEYESVRGGRSQSYSSRTDDRPLATLEGKPAFLAAARERLDATEENADVPFALLLAQYGEFEGVDRLAARLKALNAGRERQATEALLAGIALSRNNKYLPVLRQMAAERSEDYDLRKVLQALKGMTGADARQLRLDINRKMRNTSGSSYQTID